MYLIIDKTKMQLISSKLLISPIFIHLNSEYVNKLITSINGILKSISLIRSISKSNKKVEENNKSSKFSFNFIDTKIDIDLNSNTSVKLRVDNIDYNSKNDNIELHTIFNIKDISLSIYENDNELYKILSFEKNDILNEINLEILQNNTIDDNVKNINFSMPHLNSKIRINDLIDIINIIKKERIEYPYTIIKNDEIQQNISPLSIKIFDIQLKCYIYNDFNSPLIFININSNILYNKHFVCSLESLSNKEVKPDLTEDISIVLSTFINIYEDSNLLKYSSLLLPTNINITGSLHKNSADYSIDNEKILLNLNKNTLVPLLNVYLIIFLVY